MLKNQSRLFSMCCCSCVFKCVQLSVFNVVLTCFDMCYLLFFIVFLYVFSVCFFSIGFLVVVYFRFSASGTSPSWHPIKGVSISKAAIYVLAFCFGYRMLEDDSCLKSRNLELQRRRTDLCFLTCSMFAFFRTLQLRKLKGTTSTPVGKHPKQPILHG